MYSYNQPNCESDKYMMMNARISLSPQSNMNQYQGTVISTTFIIFGAMTSTMKCSSVVTDGIVYNVDAVHCEDINGENPFGKMTGIVGRTYTLSLHPTEKGIQIDDELFGVTDASFTRVNDDSVKIIDASVGKSGSKPGPKPHPYPHPHPHPHPSGGGGEGGLDTEAVWIILGILGLVILIAVIASVVSCCRSNNDDDASLMNNDYNRNYNNNQYGNGYYDGYYDGYRDGEWDRSSSGGDDGGDGGWDGGGYDGGGCDGGGDCGGD